MKQEKDILEEKESLQARLDEIILKKSEQNTALKKLLEELTRDEEFKSLNQNKK